MSEIGDPAKMHLRFGGGADTTIAASNCLEKEQTKGCSVWGRQYICEAYYTYLQRKEVFRFVPAEFAGITIPRQCLWRDWAARTCMSQPVLAFGKHDQGTAKSEAAGEDRKSAANQVAEQGQEVRPDM